MSTPISLFFQRMRTPLIVLISAYAIAILGFTIVSGTDEHGDAWRMNFLHAFYVVSYTGSTIGFGEIPSEFSDGQRMWTIVCIYLTVISWLYAIGSLIALVQDGAFRQVIRQRYLMRSIGRITEPFYLVCGYGDSGRTLVENVAARGRRVVVVDHDRNAIQSLELREHGFDIPGVTLDARVPGHLLQAGLQSRWCAGLLAVTGDDEANLKIAISGRLLNRQLTIVGRAEHVDTASNMASFDTNFVIRPATEFARRVALAMTRPHSYRLYERLTEAGAPEQWQVGEPMQGRWILCGFGSYGVELYRTLREAGIDIQVIDDGSSRHELPEGTVCGRSLEADTLVEAGIRQAAGLVTTHADDAENLSTIITAKALNEKLLFIARENHLHNRQLFAEAGTHLASSVSGIIASAIRPVLEAPLVVSFIDQILAQDQDWSRRCLQRLEAIAPGRSLQFWGSRISRNRTPALAQALEAGHRVTAGTLLRNPGRRQQRLAAVVMMIRRDDQDFSLPAEDMALAEGDRLLFCGLPEAVEPMAAGVSEPDLMHYLITGEHRSAGWLWKRLGGAIQSQH